MLKAYNSLSETIFSDLLIKQENTYNFHRDKEFQIPRVNTAWNDSNSLGISDQIF